MTDNTTILVVDDMEINRVILRMLFQQESIVLEAENGQQALEILAEHPEIDLVISDIVMPVMDGFETLAAIRKQHSLAHLPVVICTEHTDVDVQVRALDLGSSDFITKPFNARVVRHRVRNLIEMREMERKIAEQQKADQLRSTLNSIVSPLGLFEFTGNRLRSLYLNQSLSEMVNGIDAGPENHDHDLLKAMFPEDAVLLMDLLNGNLENGTPVDMTYRTTRTDSTIATHELHALSIRYEHYQNPVYLTSIADITDQRRTEVALRDTDQRLKSLINAVPGGIVNFDITDNLRVTFFNDTAGDILKLSRTEFQAQAVKNILAFVYPEDMSIVNRLIEDFKQNPRTVRDTFRVVCKDGELRWVHLSAAPIITAEGSLLASCVCTDISVEKEAELKLEQAFKEMKYRSEHDALTDILNRETFTQKVQEMLLKNADTPYVMLALNIQRFKMINELFGVDIGDRVLVTLSSCMEELFGHMGICGRMEADHFMACFPLKELDMDHVTQFLDNKLKTQYFDYHIAVLFGIYKIRKRTITVDQMCDRATMALKTISESAVKRYAFYDDAMRKNLMEEQAIIEEMNDALQQGQFIPYLQPIYGLGGLKPVSAEVLVRWKHPVKGMISPATFIPLFERNGFVTKLDFAIWEQACALLHKWKTNGMPLLPLSINISRIDLYHPHLCEDLLALLKKYDLDPSLLKLEITESAYIDDPDVLMGVLKRLRAAGFRILMDDFGSGYSSLNTLKDMPINVLKVDMSFLAALEDSPKAANILTSVVRMAKWLDLPVISEGVETKAQLDFLYSIGCDEGQGFLFSRPLPVSEFELLLQNTQEKGNGRKVRAIQECDLDFLWNGNMDVNLLFTNMIGGMALFELRGDVLVASRVNDAYYQVLNCTPQEMFRDTPNALDSIDIRDQKLLLEICRAAIRSHRVECVTVREKEVASRQRWFEHKIYHLSSDKEYPLFLFIIYDVTARKEAEWADASNQRALFLPVGERLHAPANGDSESLALKTRQSLERVSGYILSGLGLLELRDQKLNILYLSESYLNILGYSLDDFPDFSPQSVSLLLPEDAERLYQQITENAPKNKPTDIKYRAFRKDGSMTWLRAQIRSMALEDSKSFLLLASITDANREVQLEEQLHNQMLFRQVFLSEVLFVFQYDLDMKEYKLLYSDANTERSYYSYDHYTLPKGKDSPVHPNDLPLFQNFLSQEHLLGLREQKDERDRIQIRIKNLRGEWVWVELNVEQPNETQDKTIKFLFWMKVVDRQKRAEADLRKRAEVDPVSGLLNRRTAQERIIHMLNDGSDTCHAFFLLDIDNFKLVNDNFGHVAGDAVILAVSKALRKSFRSTDLVGRLGGDEFVVFMPYSGGDALLRAKAEKALDSIRNLTFPNHPSIKLSVSMGVALAPMDGNEFDLLYKRADQAMYDMKAHGKNGYRRYGELEMEEGSPLPII